MMKFICSLLSLSALLSFRSCDSADKKAKSALPRDSASITNNNSTPVAKNEEADEPGGKTRQHLGRKVIAVLVSNNKNAYIDCIHPAHRKNAEQEFDNLRNHLMKSGLADWSKVKFQQAFFTTNKGSSRLVYYTAQFTYGAKNRGAVGCCDGVEQLNGRYYASFPFKEWSMQ